MENNKPFWNLKQIESNSNCPLLLTIITPLEQAGYISLQQFFRANSHSILQQLNLHAALLLRNFDLCNPNEASGVLNKLGLSNHYTPKASSFAVGSQKSPSVNMYAWDGSQQISTQLDEKLEHSSQYAVIFYQKPNLNGQSLKLLDTQHLHKVIMQQYPNLIENIKKHGIKYCEGEKWVNIQPIWEKCIAAQILHGPTKVKLGDGSQIDPQFWNKTQELKNACVATLQVKKNDLLIFSNRKVAVGKLRSQAILRQAYIGFMSGTHSAHNERAQITLVLNSGDQMPCIGYGTWKITKEVCSESVYLALKNNYRLLDCAAIYANQEKVGVGIRRAFDQKILKRQELFVTTKLWNHYHRAENVRPACLKSLKDLGLDYIDLYLIHFPISIGYVPIQEHYPAFWNTDYQSTVQPLSQDPVPIRETWKAMEQLVSQGLVRNIGISNFKTSLIRDLLYCCEIRPAVIQNQVHPFLTEKRLIRFCREQKIQFTSYSTIGAASYVNLLDNCNQNEQISESQQVIELAKHYNKTAVQIVLRWAYQLGLAIIPKSTKEERIKQNYAITNFSLTDSDIQKISSLNRNRRFNDTAYYQHVFMHGKYIPTFG